MDHTLIWHRIDFEQRHFHEKSTTDMVTIYIAVKKVERPLSILPVDSL